MRRLFIANLHFEQQIAGDRQSLPLEAERLTAELAACWLPVCESGDEIWCPHAIPEEFWHRMADAGLPLVAGISKTSEVPADCELVPWGWSPLVRQFGRRVHAHCHAPPADAVLICNSRRFAWELEQDWNVGLNRSAAVASQAELEGLLRTVDHNDRWVLKAELGAAARHRVLCTGPIPDSTSAGWIRKRFSFGERLYFEPWVERLDEVGIQWTIPRNGPPVLAGVTRLLTSPVGQYRGSIFGLTESERTAWQPAIDTTQRAVERIQDSGYFGPVGIDAMRYRDQDGQLRFRPLQDINARWTMGRLALGWRRIMTSGTWRHGTVDEFTKRAQADPRILRTSPERVGDEPARFATWLEPAASSNL